MRVAVMAVVVKEGAEKEGVEMGVAMGVLMGADVMGAEATEEV